MCGLPFIRKKKWDKVEGLLQEIRQLLEQPDASRKQGDAQVHVHIETLHMHEVKLDDLSFRLDQISIEDLSGSFNLGNNFLQHTGKGSPHQRADKSEAAGKQEKGSSGQARKERIHSFEGSGDDRLERSATGFRFRFNR